MALIREDNKGLYAKVDGYVARPTEATTFNKGDNIKGNHFSGSLCVGMGKLPGRNNYQEVWLIEE